MQLQKADLEGLFEAWLVRKACGIARFCWRMYHRPKSRHILLLTLYTEFHAAVLDFLTALYRAGHFTDPAKIAGLRAYIERTKVKIDRWHERIDAMPEDG